MSIPLSSRLLSSAVSFVLLSSSMLLLGCGMGVAAPEGHGFVPDAKIGGVAMGGQQPLHGATVNIYAVGTTGYGSSGTLLATTTTGLGGSFGFTQSSSLTGPTATVSSTYGCPTPSTLIYLMIIGGDPTNTVGGTSNSAIKLMDALGSCSSVGSSFFVVNEVSNVVSVAALQQYLSPINETIGSPSTTAVSSNQSAATTGIANAFALVNSILNQPAGIVNPTYSPTSALGVVTATPEVAKINTIADILAACVNTTSSSSQNCLALFSAAVQPSEPEATNFATSYAPAINVEDTLQATLFMLQNPTNAGTQVGTCNGHASASNLACLFSLVSPTPPFPGLGVAPADWTIAVTYASPSTQSVNGGTLGYLTYPQRLAIDKMGNVWVTNNVTASATATAGLTELSPTGGLMQQVLTGSGVLLGPRTPTLDPDGNVWVANFGSATVSSAIGYAKTVVEYTTGGATNVFNVGGCPTWLASDGAGNMLVGECSVAVNNSGGGNGTPGGDLEVITAGSASGTSASVLATTASGYNLTTYGTLGVDSNFNVWVASGGTTVMAFAPPYTAAPSSFTATDPEPLGIDAANNVFVANYGTASTAGVDKLFISSGVIANAPGAPFAGGGLAAAELGAIDGAGTFWVTDYASSTTGYLTAFSNTGVALSPATGGFAHTFTGAFGVAVDPSGNVWVGNNTAYSKAATAASGSNGGAAAGGYLTEIIGAAVPVVTPIAAGLPASAGGASLLGSTPQ